MTELLADARSRPRLRLDPPLDVRVGRVAGSLHDLTVDGARVRHPEARVSVGDCTVLELQPGSADRILVLCRFVWIAEANDGLESGLEFIGLGETVRRRIAAIIRSRAS